MTSHVKPVGIALSTEHLAALLADRALTARLNASGLPFAVAGVDRIDSVIPRPEEGPADRAVDPADVATTLADNAPDLGWLTVAVAQRGDQRNLARRAASADYLSGGRAGLVLGLRDRLGPARPAGRSAWAGKSRPASPTATRDAAAAIRALWQGWPPASPQGTPVLAWRAESTGEAAAAGRVADILIWPASRPDRLGQVAAASSGARLFLEMPVGGGDLGPRLARNLADEHVAGVILRPEASETALRDFLARALPALASAGAFRAGWSGTLRTRLSLPVPARLPAAAPEPALASA